MTKDLAKLDARAFGLAAALIGATLTTICAIALVVSPSGTTSVASALFHLDLSSMERNLSWPVYFQSLIGWTLGAGLVFWSAARLYNAIIGTRQAVPVFGADFATKTRS